MPLSFAILHANNETPVSRGPAIEAGTLAIAPVAGLTTPEGISLILPAVIQLPNTVTIGSGAFTWNAAQEGVGVVDAPAGIDGPEYVPMVTLGWWVAAALRISHSGLFAGVLPRRLPKCREPPNTAFGIVRLKPFCGFVEFPCSVPSGT